MLNTRRLILERLYNARDLGGYAVPGGRTKFGVFLRSEMPYNISEKDKKALKDYGVTVSLDFRSTPEKNMMPSDLSDEGWVEYVHMPTYPEAGIFSGDEDFFRPDFSVEDFAWGGEYIKMLENGKDWARACVEKAAECDGVLHYHCYTGKDRTGVFSAILLSVAGAERWDIAADYCVSQALLDRFYIEHVQGYDTENRRNNLENKFIHTRSSNMFMLLDYVDKAYGGMDGYLKDCGVNVETLEKIRDKFTEKF